MIRTLLTPRWAAALAAATAFFVLCLFLGRWQWGRHQERSAFADAVHRNYHAATRPLEDVLPEGATLSDAQLWTRVTVRGHYAVDATMYVRNRPQKVTYGYEIVVPLKTATGAALLVDRGWVKNAERADILPQTPPAPTGEVQVTGWLRHGEADLGRNLPARQLASINLSDAAREYGSALRPAYLVLDTEDVGRGQPPERPAPLLPPDTGTGPHLAYSLQWWGGSVVGFVIVLVYARREHLDALHASGERPAAPPRPKKTRIWDEEDA